MAFYTALSFILLIPIFFCQPNGDLNRSVTWVCVTPLIILTAIKGETGTDTSSYIMIFSEIAAIGSSSSYNYEPAFQIYANIVSNITNSPIFAINFLATSSVILITFAVIKSKNCNQKLLYTVIFSYIIIDASFNTLRFGAALALFLYGTTYHKISIKKSLACFITATTFQLSTAYLIFIFLLIKTTLTSTRIIVTRTIAAVVGLAFFIRYYAENISEKFTLYLSGDYTSPSTYSGLAPLLIITSTYLMTINQKKHIKTSTIIFFLSIIYFLLAKYSYMFLRLLIMNIVILGLISNPAKTKATQMYIVIFIFILGSSLKMKNFSDESVHLDSKSPFIPYRSAI